jgi:hypothetical protein
MIQDYSPFVDLIVSDGVMARATVEQMWPEIFSYHTAD